MILKVTPYHFEEIIEQLYTLDQIFLLKMICENIEVSTMLVNSQRMTSIYQSLVRKGLVDDYVVTKTGLEILQFMNTTKKTKLIRKKTSNTEFDTWWTSFPGTDTFSINSKKFSGSRGLKRNMEECRIKFNRIVEQGIHKPSEIIDATLLDVQMKKENSFKTGDNRLSYIQNSLTYLNQMSYEPFIDLLKDKTIINNQSNTGGTDV